MSLKTRVLFTVLMIAMAAAIAAQALNIFDTQASFLKSCNYTQDTIMYNSTVGNEVDALAVLAKYTNVTELSYDKYPTDYMCNTIQFYFQNNRTHEQFYVCKDGTFIKKTPQKCGYSTDFSVIPDVGNIMPKTGP